MSNPKEVTFSWKDYQEIKERLEAGEIISKLIRDMSEAGVSFVDIEEGYKQLLINTVGDIYTSDGVSKLRVVIRGVK